MPLNLTYFKCAWLAILCILTSIVSCSTIQPGTAGNSATDPRLQAKAAKSSEFLHINSLAILTPHLGRGVGGGAIRQSDVLSSIISAATLAELQVVDPTKVSTAAALVPTAQSVSDSVAIARRVGADAVLVTEIRVFEERHGSRVGANVAAQVGFGMSLYRTKDSLLLWDGSYFYKEKAASENLLDIPERGSLAWHSGAEILQRGLEAAFSSIAESRRSVFLSH